MDASASLRQTVTHLFDAVRYSSHAREVAGSAAEAEKALEKEMAKLESRTEELSNLISSMKGDEEEAIRYLAQQLLEFLETAKAQASEKLARKAKGAIDEYKRTASSERDKALKSLEAYLASDPLPAIELVVEARLVEGRYEARLRCECEGGIRYEFVLAAQNSKMFHQELMLSQLGYEVRVPVRFAKTLLKGRVPGFEKLDQYVVTDAEASAGKIRATFSKVDDRATIKVVTSGSGEDGFLGLEYSNQTQSVNITNDPSLSGHVDMKAIKDVMAELVKDLDDLAAKKVSLVKLSVGGEDVLKSMDCFMLMQKVLNVLGPEYREVVTALPETLPSGESNGSFGLKFVRERLKTLGALSEPVSRQLGLVQPA
jgi:hypothetical protein